VVFFNKVKKWAKCFIKIPKQNAIKFDLLSIKLIYTMENEENKKEAAQGTDHPKPTDDVQLEIETVIPSTEKETDKPGEPEQKPEEVKDEEKVKSGDQEEETDVTEKPAKENKTDNDDKRDDIETVTPSA